MKALLITFALVATFVASAAPAAAQSSPDFDLMLGAYDTIPTPEALEAIPNVRDRLEAAARSGTRTLYERHRGITLLSAYPDARTRGFLESLLDDVNPEIRRMAVYTLGRTFGNHADALLVARIVRVLEQDDAMPATWALRALRWVRHDDALRALSAAARATNPRLARLAAAMLRDHVMFESPEGPQTR